MTRSRELGFMLEGLPGILEPDIATVVFVRKLVYQAPDARRLVYLPF